MRTRKNFYWTFRKKVIYKYKLASFRVCSKHIVHNTLEKPFEIMFHIAAHLVRFYRKVDKQACTKRLYWKELTIIKRMLYKIQGFLYFVS